MKTYSEAGVDIDRGDRFVDFIKSIRSRAVDTGIGGFSSALPLDTLGFTSPVLMTTTDGTGTKLLVARKLGRYDTIGIDLVAMNVNDLVVCGAKPIVFLDYIACARIDETRMHAVIQGIVRGCEIAGCSLGGGETAEMPDLYGADDFDLAGFAVGLAEKGSVLPRKAEIRRGRPDPRPGILRNPFQRPVPGAQADPGIRQGRVGGDADPDAHLRARDGRR